MALADVYDLSINYVLGVGTGEVQKLVDTFTELFPQHKKTTMTAARQLEKRGEIKGKIEGKLEGKIEGRQIRSIEIARNLLLKLHLDIDIVEKATELSKSELEKILQGKS